ncbi:hypothetical protein ANN_14216 [Periplaneta americana]|uniref:Uncharacterized protein n=1 Tax=Periplaneta americana TaxID=6978 RepID=A0ABQ8SX69_PERAM|nr:hypothetical protein ANN_14216 [Periplaneta americana]
MTGLCEGGNEPPGSLKIRPAQTAIIERGRSFGAGEPFSSSLERRGREKEMDTFKKVRDLCEVIFNIELREEHVDHTYRLGKGNKRPIFLSLKNRKVREVILNNLGRLRGSGVRVETDMSFEVRNRRKRLLPYMKAARAKGHFAKMYEDNLKVNGKWYDLEFCLRNEDHPEFGLTRRTKEDKVDVCYMSEGKEQKKIIPTSRTEQVIVADHMVTGANSSEFRNPHADVRGSVEVMTHREDKCNVIKQRKQIPSLHTMAVRLAHSRRNADNNGTRSTGVRKRRVGIKEKPRVRK